MRAPSSEVLAGQVLLAVENVSLSFGGVKAIRDVSFDIRKGEIRAIIGPNGAGKTSLLNVINGFYQPQEGRITFRGETREDSVKVRRRPANSSPWSPITSKRPSRTLRLLTFTTYEPRGMPSASMVSAAIMHISASAAGEAEPTVSASNCMN